MPKKLLKDMMPVKSKNKETPKEKVSIIKARPNVDTGTQEKFEKKTTVSFLSGLPKIHETTSYSYDESLFNTYSKSGTHNSSKNGLWVVAFIAIVFLFFAFSSIFAKAKVVVEPKKLEVALSHNFSAFKDSNSEDVLPFNLVSLSDEESKMLPTIEEREASEFAKGKVVLYNNFSITPQKLNKDTRIIGTNDKIYKTESEVTIPGMLKADPSKGIKESTPGSVEVFVYANESGAEYNTRPIDFKILGFKGTKKYDYFYGRGKGDITGGLKGKYNFVSPEEMSKAEEELKSSLEKKLLEKIKEEIPEGYILLQNGTIFRIDDKEGSLFSSNKEASFVLRGTLYGFLFDEKILTKKIVEASVPNYDNGEVYIPNIKDLVFTASLPVGISSYLNIKDIDFKLSGNVKVIWRVDEEKLKNSLLSKPKKDFTSTLSQFTSIDKANLTLRPIWRTEIPAKTKDIKILVNY